MEIHIQIGSTGGEASHQLQENEVPTSFWSSSSIDGQTIGTLFNPGDWYGIRCRPERKSCSP